MQRLRLVIAALVAVFVCVGFSACQKDGVFNPKKKISRISMQEPGYPVMVASSFIWDGNKLQKIDYGNGGFITFSYDGKRLSTMNSSAGVVVSFKYDGSKLEELEYTYAGRKYLEIDVEHDGKNISKLVYHQYDYNGWDDDDWKMNVQPLKMFLPEATCDHLAKAMMAEARSGKKGETVSTIEFEYDKKNIVRERWIELARTYEYTYDDKCNPFYGSLLIDHDAVEAIESYNNVVRVNAYGGTAVENYSYSFEYEYDGKWPTARREIDENGDLEQTVFYEYVK